MDSQSNDKNSRVSFTQIYTNLFATRRARAWLFIGSFIIAIAISVSFIIAIALSTSFTSFIDEVGFSYLIVLLFFFPAAIGALILNGIMGGDPGSFYGYFAPIVPVIASILWVVYLVIMRSGILTKNIRTAKVLFFVLAVLLLLNVGGCYSYFFPSS